MTGAPEAPGAVRALAEERAGPYLRALGAALHAAAPDKDWPSLRAAALHLHLLDPACSGQLFLPAEVDAASGLPSHGWLERAGAERRAGADPDHLAGLVERARRVDPVLAERLSWRRTVALTERGVPVLPALEQGVELVRRGARPAARLRLDRRLPGIGWVRLRVDLRGRAAGLRGLRIERRTGQLSMEPGLGELLLRHALSPLVLLGQVLAEACGAEVDRLSRATIGPFWFPGGSLPAGLPPAVAQTLTLHLSRTVLSRERAGLHAADPLLPVPPPPPAGLGLVQERHLVVHRAGRAAVAAWQPGVSLAVFG
jgi:hypothetical protein